jgi:ribosomal protein S27E
MKKPIPIKSALLTIKSVTNKNISTKCKHRQIEVDRELQEVTCATCGERLNPIAILERMAGEETMWHYQRQRLREAQAKLDKKIRTKCRHCGKLTDVNI